MWTMFEVHFYSICISDYIDSDTSIDETSSAAAHETAKKIVVFICNQRDWLGANVWSPFLIKCQ